MDNRISSFFENEKIEYFSALDYKDLREINPRLVERHGMTPRSALIFLIPYYAGRAENLSIYAASFDYHIIIKEITDRLIGLLREIYPENHFLGFGDHSPIDERSAALISGLGILGENGLLINEKYGSYVFLADVITDVPPSLLGVEKKKEISFCEGCGACKRACPTGILRGECAECLSAITQKKGELSDFEVELMMKVGTVWGCDACQTACPYNQRPKMTPIEFFFGNRIEYLTSEKIDSMTNEEFAKRAFAWRGKKTIKRNLEHFEKSYKT
ncbi:MAG: epoxyqueuosine reductase [Clostridia bacterium]|nr:epoxyqueuosine reductase [Clostridia bacterium]